jgi:putative hydrolase of the HAD superfamily
LKAVLFDAGNTLLFLDHDRMAAAIGVVLGAPLEAGRLAGATGTASRAAERTGGADRDRARAYLEALLLDAGVPPERMEEVAVCLQQVHDESHLWCQVAEDTRVALDRLRTRGLRLGVVSNSDGRVEQALVAAGIREYFEVVLDSALVGMEKPDPTIFRAALGALGVAASEALYVGDLYHVDVVGARAAGMEGVLLGPDRDESRPDCLRFASLTALADDLLNGVRP